MGNIKQILQRHLPVDVFQMIKHRMRLIFSKTMNIGQAIDQHNESLLNETGPWQCEIDGFDTRECTCPQTRKNNCYFDNMCNKGGIYKFILSSEKNEETFEYIGSTNCFKRRKREHLCTTSNSVISRFLEKNEDYNAKMVILKVIERDKIGGKRCQLCLKEKLAIYDWKAESSNVKFLNSKSEILSSCKHNSVFGKFISRKVQNKVQK